MPLLLTKCEEAQDYAMLGNILHCCLWLVSFPDPPTKNGGRVWEMGLYVRVEEEFVARNYMQPQSWRVKPRGRADNGCLLRQQRQQQ